MSEEKLEARAITRSVRLSPRKTRLVVDQIRGKPVEKALEYLTFERQKPAHYVRKTLDSAISNAEHNEGLDVDQLVVKEAFVNEGPALKRFRPRAMGRATMIQKPTSHITIVVAQA
ncbi:50S ribosomal protein L22 [Thiohalorhabdus denitrificans]|uniref:Large ribosomal subunit protein uL22 n=1 Tax=Thiohalorhabdus denitrificans TaxID=381306 RepID=A0A0P9ER46_9GAMM|nr:50S ribosomal protein L22 [Thiohalorhabdus denitrificans]KPV40959.1 50S ribosomal protein L22 [Thiohalorhabdus denitrificans]SCY43309.1 LSU ribosomal protein L22P [Thiohalorhabdus denitrificans]